MLVYLPLLYCDIVLLAISLRHTIIAIVDLPILMHLVPLQPKMPPHFPPPHVWGSRPLGPLA